jgi:hypothetical protein
VSRLLDRLDALVLSCTSPSSTDQDIRAALERDAARQAPLTTWNIGKSQHITAGIHLAADQFLSPAFRARHEPHRWPGALRAFLERRHGSFGLDGQPCARKVREALQTWRPPQINSAPPYGSSTDKA